MTNVAKTAVMFCQPGTISGEQSSAAYDWQITGEGEPHHMRQLHRVVCGKCGEELEVTSISAHL